MQRDRARRIIATAMLLGLGAGLAGGVSWKARAAAPHTVVQKGRAFMPGDLAMDRGDTLIFENSDDTSHNMFSTSAGNSFDLKLQKPGETKSIIFSQAGVVEIECDIHPKMHLTVTVR